MKPSTLFKTMSFLRYYDGAAPVKKRKKTDEERSAQQKMYEAKRPPRKFNDKWRTVRSWLVYDETEEKMKCSVCRSFYGDHNITDDRHASNTFLTGCVNFRISAVEDNEKSKGHVKAVASENSKNCSVDEKMTSDAGQSLKMLKVAEKHKISYLFRNAHAVAKQNRPLSDYKWLCEVDRAKKIDIGYTYINDKAAVEFISCIAQCEKDKTVKVLNDCAFFSFMMDGTTDISGDEQEAIYVRTSSKGVVTERFLNIGSPRSTKAEDLFEHVLAVFEECKINKDKLVGMGSDGASNMIGSRSGLSTLLKQRINPELVNIHCLCHRLELAFRDTLKKSKLYDKLMTLLIGIHYFYKKSYKNKSALLNAIEAVGKGVLPPKVTGTRWLPHLCREIGALLKTYRAFEAHLSTASHENAKAEGFLKLMLDKHVLAFAIFLQDALDHVMTLSLKLQRDDVTLSDSMCWVDSTVELLEEKKGRKCQSLCHLLETGMYDGIKLQGATPSMTYTDEILQGLSDAIKTRFMTDQRNKQNATKILNFGNWPAIGTPELQEFGQEELFMFFRHFHASICRLTPDITEDTMVNQWSLLKKIVTKKHGVKMSCLSWKTVLQENCDLEQICLVIDIMLTIPSTSVKCETAFSQLKLLKTCRRSKLGTSCLNDLMIVKLQSPPISSFDPEDAIDKWLNSSLMGRRVTYTRPKSTAANPQIVLEDTDCSDNDIDSDSDDDSDDECSDNL